MPELKTFRLLTRAQPERAAVEKLISGESDAVLLGAVANPEHSDAARQALRELAQRRGLPVPDDIGWAAAGATRFVAPFGSRPSFEDALAAPRRRRRIYRTLQAVMI